MTYVVGYSPHKNDLGALELACQFARSESAPVHAVTVVPRGWGTPVVGATDREFEQWAAAEGEASAELAMRNLAEFSGIEASASWVTGRSVPQALLEQATALDATILVVGSGEDASPGQIALTSKSGRLVHSSTIPVAIAPRGYEANGARINRITVGFRDDDATWTLLQRVARIARQVSASLRVVTFAVEPQTMVTSGVSHAEAQVLERWIEQAEAAQRESAEYLRSEGFSDDLELSIAQGHTWRKAVRSLAWKADDILVVGSSSTHQLAQVFLGSSAAKIVRHSPVPVVVVP